MMQKQSPWEIKIARKAETLAEFSVPAYKLTKNALHAFLKAIVASERGGPPESMVLFYLNKRRGEPSRLPFAEIRSHEDLEHNRIGYFCGDWECYASAMQEIDPSIVVALKKELRRNKGV
jgi:hypothetical protein